MGSRAFTATSSAALSSNDPKRFGLLGQASILAVTSYPNRTAPTIRGKWVLEQLLGTPPPPPPPNVPSLKDDADHAEADHAPTHGTAPRQSRMRCLPPHDGPARLRAGQFRRHRQLARLHWTRFGTDRFLRYPARRHPVQWAGGLARGPAEKAATCSSRTSPSGF